MLKSAILLASSVILTGCCMIHPEKCRTKEICTPKEPIVVYQYSILPDYLVAPCIRPEPFPLDLTSEDFARLLDKRKGDHNLCADRIDTIRLRNEEFKKANETEKKLDVPKDQP